MSMFTIYFGSVILFWVIGFIVWNSTYPKNKEGER